eukprot:PhM_4_TR3643/c0_g1_i1/m.8063
MFFLSFFLLSLILFIIARIVHPVRRVAPPSLLFLHGMIPRGLLLQLTIPSPAQLPLLCGDGSVTDRAVGTFAENRLTCRQLQILVLLLPLLARLHFPHPRHFHVLSLETLGVELGFVALADLVGLALRWAEVREEEITAPILHRGTQTGLALGLFRGDAELFLQLLFQLATTSALLFELMFVHLNNLLTDAALFVPLRPTTLLLLADLFRQEADIRRGVVSARTAVEETAHSVGSRDLQIGTLRRERHVHIPHTFLLLADVVLQLPVLCLFLTQRSQVLLLRRNRACKVGFLLLALAAELLLPRVPVDLVTAAPHRRLVRLMRQVFALGDVDALGVGHHRRDVQTGAGADLLRWCRSTVVVLCRVRNGDLVGQCVFLFVVVNIVGRCCCIRMLIFWRLLMLLWLVSQPRPWSWCGCRSGKSHDLVGRCHLNKVRVVRCRWRYLRGLVRIVVRRLTLVQQLQTARGRAHVSNGLAVPVHIVATSVTHNNLAEVGEGNRNGSTALAVQDDLSDTSNNVFQGVANGVP